MNTQSALSTIEKVALERVELPTHGLGIGIASIFTSIFSLFLRIAEHATHHEKSLKRGVYIYLTATLLLLLSTLTFATEPDLCYMYGATVTVTKVRAVSCGITKVKARTEDGRKLTLYFDATAVCKPEIGPPFPCDVLFQKGTTFPVHYFVGSSPDVCTVILVQVPVFYGNERRRP